MRLSVAFALTILPAAALSQEFSPAGFGAHELSPINTVRVPFNRPPGGYDVALTSQVIVGPKAAVHLTTTFLQE